MDIIAYLDANVPASTMLLIGYGVSALIQALPKPKEDSGVAYQIMYNFFHLLVANWKLVGKQIRENKENRNGS